MRVLIVEDEKSLRSLVAQVATARGHEVVAVADAEAALQLYKQAPFPFIIVDWVLPGMTGIELCRLVRALPDGDTPFILLSTGRVLGSDLESSLAAGADDYIAKPIDVTLLATRITVAEQVIAQRRKRHAAEQALMSSERRFATVFQRSPAAISIMRQSDHGVVDVNDSFARVFGVTRAEVLDGRVPADDILAKLGFARMAKKLAAQGGIVNETISFTQPPSGTLVHMLASVEPIEFGGEPCWLMMCYDVTESERLRAQLMFADRMASVGTLAAGVAHEINNPLAYLIANLGFLSEELARFFTALRPQLGRLSVRVDEQDITDSLSEARQGAERVKAIVRDLKTFSRADEEQQGAVELRDVLESAINLAWNEIRHRARLVKDYGEVPRVFGNVARLGQVFVNLLVNAAQSIVEGDAKKNVIRIVTASDADGNATVEIRDSGVGIHADFLERIFDPFFTTKPVGVGTGLGLSICHAIVTSFGGRISVQSEQGKGSVFSVTLVPAKVAEVIEVEPQPFAAASRRGRVLVIDDEAMIGKSLHRALTFEHDIQSVTTAKEALERLEAGEQFDLILCDLMMPEMSGMEFHAKVAEQHKQVLGSLVFLTGGAFTPRAKSFVESVASPCLEKPLDMHVLRRMIKDHVERDRALP